MNLKSLRKSTSFDNVKLNILSKWTNQQNETGISIAFTSRRPQEGTSTIVAGLAEAFSRSSLGKIFVLDCAPSAHRVADILNIQSKTLSMEGLQKKDIKLSELIVKDEDRGIEIITLEKINSEDSQNLIKLLIDQAKQKYQIILVDNGSLSKGGTQWLQHSNYRVLVIDASKNTHEILEHQNKEFEHMGTSMHGFIINKREYPIPRFLYGLTH